MNQEDWEGGEPPKQVRAIEYVKPGPDGGSVLTRITKHTPSEIGRLKRRLNRLRRALRHLNQARSYVAIFGDDQEIFLDDDACFDAEAHWSMCVIHYYAAIGQEGDDQLFYSHGQSLISHLRNVFVRTVEEDYTLVRRYANAGDTSGPADDLPKDHRSLIGQHMWQDGIDNMEWLPPGLGTLDHVAEFIRMDMAAIDSLIERARLQGTTPTNSGSRRMP